MVASSRGSPLRVHSRIVWSYNFLNGSLSFCSRRGDWPAVPGKREPRGALQAPGARDHFHPDWRQVIVTWFNSFSPGGGGGRARFRRGVNRWSSARFQVVSIALRSRVSRRVTPSITQHEPDDAEYRTPLWGCSPLWRVLFNFTRAVIPLHRSGGATGLLTWNKLLSIIRASRNGKEERGQA